MEPVYKEGTTELQIIEDGYSRGFKIEQIKSELKAQGFYVKDYNLKLQLDQFDILYGVKPICQEDECAPDAREYFDKEMKEAIGLTCNEFKEKTIMQKSKDGMTSYWELEYDGVHYRMDISADFPFYSLYNNNINKK